MTSIRTGAIVAGVGYVAIFALAFFANFAVRERLVVVDDPAATVDNLSASLGLFRWGMVAFLAVFVIDVVVAWALHVVFREADRDLSLVAAWSRLTYTVLLGVALVFFFEVLTLLGPSSNLVELDPALIQAQVMVAVETFDAAWLIGLAVFGLHLVVLGALIVRSRIAPRAMGWLLMAAGVAYVVDTVAHIVVPDYDAYADAFLALVAVPSIIGEGWLGLWLLLRAGVRPASTEARQLEEFSRPSPSPAGLGVRH